MSADDNPRVSFEQAAAQVHQGPLRDLKVVAAAEAEVPGFTAYEITTVSGFAVRGWASADGVAVLARRQNFGPILDALRFRDDNASMSARDIASRIAWVHGDDHELLERVQKGDLGAAENRDVPPMRARRPDGSVALTLVLRITDAEDPAGSAIVEYAIVARPDATYRVDVSQIAPPGADDDD